MDSPVTALRPFEKPEFQWADASLSVVARATRFLSRAMLVGGSALVLARIVTVFKAVTSVSDAEWAASELLRDVNFARVLYTVARLEPKGARIGELPRRELPGVPQKLSDQIELMNARVIAFARWRKQNPTRVPVSIERLTRSASTPEYAAAFTDPSVPASIRSAYLAHHAAMFYIAALTLVDQGVLPKKAYDPTAAALEAALRNALRLGLALPGGAGPLDHLAKEMDLPEALDLESEERRWSEYLDTYVPTYGTTELDQVP